LAVSRKKTALLFAIIFVFSGIVVYQYSHLPFVEETGSPAGTNDAGSSANDSEHAQSMSKLIIWVYMDKQEFAVLERLNRQFQSERDILAELVNVPAAQAYEKFKTAGQMGDGPDIMLLDNSWVREFAISGLLKPTDAYFTNEWREDQLEPVLNQLQWNGSSWAIPKDIDFYTLVWNEQVFAQHAVQSPDGNIDWADVMRRFAELDISAYYLNPRDPYSFLTLLGLFGIPLAQDPSAGEGGTPPPFDALDSLLLADKESEETGSPPLWMSGLPVEEARHRLKSGQLAMMVDRIEEFLAYRDGTLRLFSAGNAPSQPAETAVPLGLVAGRSYAVSSYTDLEPEALEWLQWMTSVTAQEMYWEASGSLPAAESFYTESAAADDPILRDLPQMIERSVTLPPDPELPDKLNRLASALRKPDPDIGSTFAQIWTPVKP
jgi:maltose-binding protein MalE